MNKGGLIKAQSAELAEADELAAPLAWAAYKAAEAAYKAAAHDELAVYETAKADCAKTWRAYETAKAEGIEAAYKRAWRRNSRAMQAYVRASEALYAVARAEYGAYAKAWRAYVIAELKRAAPDEWAAYKTVGAALKEGYAAKWAAARKWAGSASCAAYKEARKANVTTRNALIKKAEAADEWTAYLSAEAAYEATKAECREALDTLKRAAPDELAAYQRGSPLPSGSPALPPRPP